LAEEANFIYLFLIDPAVQEMEAAEVEPLSVEVKVVE
jgi:hypothetical protein